MLIIHKGATSLLQSCYISYAKICIPALFLIQDVQTYTIQIVLTRWLYSTLVLKRLAHLMLQLSSFHPLYVTKTLVWQKQIKVALFQLRADFSPHSSGYVTLRGTSRTSRAIKALLSPVPPRHLWLHRISTWAGNLSSCRLAVTLKSTSYDELWVKALWKSKWCLPE